MSDYRTDRPYWCEICARKKECYGITLKPKCFVSMADRKTENSSEIPNNSLDKDTNVRSKTEPQRNMAEDIAISFGFKAESYRQAKAKTEPQTERSSE